MNRYKVQKSSAGLGLFAIAPFVKGDFVIEYTGDRLTDDEADKRGGRYLFTVKKNLILDGKDRKHTARYMNHSCRPNCYAEVDEDNDRLRIYAKRKIAVGEELTYNYGKEYWNDYIGKNCRCEKCRGAFRKTL